MTEREYKHTPGPWEDDRSEHDQPYLPVTIKSGKFHKICTIWIDDAPVHDFNDEQYANAHLIAAAPELLEALVNCVAVHEGAGGTKYHAWDIARAAIAKAKGESK